MTPVIHHDAAMGPQGIECVAIINAEAVRVFGRDRVKAAVRGGENVVFHRSDAGGVVMAVESDSHLLTAVMDELHDAGRRFVLDLARSVGPEKDIVPRSDELTWFRDHPGRMITAEEAVSALFDERPELADEPDDDQPSALQA